MSSCSDNEFEYILVTGGCGYIGTHTLVCLLNDPSTKYAIVVVDNLINSSKKSLDRVAQICNFNSEQRSQRLLFHQVDICDEEELRKVFIQHQSMSIKPFRACIHFAGLKAVGESQRIPLKYYHNNLSGTFVLLQLLQEYNCRQLVFSSSATVYGAAETMPITEDTTVGTGITNAYGRTKYMIEEVLTDFYNSTLLNNEQQQQQQQQWSITILRYFNPVGAHPTGLIGEDPNGIPNNLMPYVSQVAIGRRPFLTVFGNDYNTPDGTGVRDYLHVMDLAQGHLSAIQYMNNKGRDGLHIFNLGTGNGYSVLQMIHAMEKACGHSIAYQIGPRRPGDIATCYADPKKAEQEMGWKATKTLDDMCVDLWCWQSNNPNGYSD